MKKLTKWDKIRAIFFLVLIIGTFLYVVFFGIPYLTDAGLKNMERFLEYSATKNAEKQWEKYKVENRKQICKQISQGNDELLFECRYQYPSKAEFEKFYFQNKEKDRQ